MHVYLFIIENFLIKYVLGPIIIGVLIMLIFEAIKQIKNKTNTLSNFAKKTVMVAFPIVTILGWSSDFIYNYIFRQELKNLGNDYNVYIESKLFNKPKEIVNVFMNINSISVGHVSNLSDKCISVNVLSKTKTIKTLICKSKQSRLNLYGIFVQEILNKKFDAMKFGTIVQDGSYPVLDEIFSNFQHTHWKGIQAPPK